jgi:hypothetical protein
MAARLAPEETKKMPTINLLARNCTLFTTTKALDEDAYCESLQRFVDFRIGPFVASGGSGVVDRRHRNEKHKALQDCPLYRILRIESRPVHIS